MAKIKSTDNIAKAVETRPVSVGVLKQKVYDLMKLRARHIAAIQEIEKQVGQLDVEIEKIEPIK